MGIDLFGTYEAVRGPKTRGVALLLSGADRGCTGSSDYELCAATYLADSPTGGDDRGAAVGAGGVDD